MVRAIPFEKPEPVRRVALAWRRGFTRPEAIQAIVDAVHGIKNPAFIAVLPLEGANSPVSPPTIQ
jgi:LysR family hydrogen peroxide-inducible transcriptional activator